MLKKSGMNAKMFTAKDFEGLSADEMAEKFGNSGNSGSSSSKGSSRKSSPPPPPRKARAAPVDPVNDEDIIEL